MILLINYYLDKDPSRQAELDRCLQLNASHPLIESIIVFHEKDVLVPFYEKIVLVEFEGRPTYSDFLRIGNMYEGVKILANSDIYFNHTLRYADLIKPRQIFALCKWKHGKQLKFCNNRGSQDVWIWRGEVYVEATFGLGILGCDNKIAWLFHTAGYSVISPSISIQCVHMHKSKERNYFNTEPLPPPYVRLRYHTISRRLKRPIIIKY